MHEAGLVKTLLQQVTEIARNHRSPRILEIHVEAGPLSGIEPCLLQSAYEREVAAFVEQPGACDIDFSTAQLAIDKVPLEATCDRCGVHFEIKGADFSCHKCGSNAVRVLRGDALRLMTVTLEDREEIRDIP